jgi:hypothetical protein
MHLIPSRPIPSHPISSHAVPAPLAQTFAGSFMPIMGKAEPVNSADEYDSDDDDIRRVRSKKKGGTWARSRAGARGRARADGRTPARM